jgi:DNA-binding XRE family transcriptional regulator
MGKGIPWRDVLGDLLTDPELAAEWERTAVARAVAIWLCRYRAEHGLTQQQLADRVGMKQAAIGRLELGETEPRVTTLLRLAAALGEALVLEVDGTGRPGEAEAVTIGRAFARAA